MATEVKLPRLGQGMESGTIVKWLKSEGEPVEKGEPLYELDTDKVTQEVEAEASGVLLKIAIPEGEVEVGKTIGFIGEQGEAVAAERGACEGGEARGGAEARRGGAGSRRRGARPLRRDPNENTTPASKASRARREAAKPRSAADEASPHRKQRHASNGSTNGRIKASPLARRIARERGVDLAQIRGTGPDGRIVAEDVERARRAARDRRQPAAAAAPAAASRVASALERPQDDRAPADAGVDRAGVPADRERRHDARERARDEAARAQPRRAHHGHRRADEALRAGADAPPRHERAVHATTRCSSSRAPTSASPSRRRRASSCRSCAAPSG